MEAIFEYFRGLRWTCQSQFNRGLVLELVTKDTLIQENALKYAIYPTVLQTLVLFLKEP